MSCLCFLCQAWTSSWNSRAGLQRQQCRGAVIQGNFILFIPISWLCLSGRVRTSGSFCSTEKWSSGPGREGWPEHLRVPSGRNQRQSPQVLYEGHHSFDLRRVSISGYSSFSHEFLYQTGGSKPSLLVSLKFWFTESLFILYRHLGLQVEADKDKRWRSCLTLYQVTRLFFQTWVCLLRSVDILNFATLIYNQSWPTVCLLWFYRGSRWAVSEGRWHCDHGGASGQWVVQRHMSRVHWFLSHQLCESVGKFYTVLTVEFVHPDSYEKASIKCV